MAYPFIPAFRSGVYSSVDYWWVTEHGWPMAAPQVTASVAWDHCNCLHWWQSSPSSPRPSLLRCSARSGWRNEYQPLDSHINLRRDIWIRPGSIHHDFTGSDLVIPDGSRFRIVTGDGWWRIHYAAC